MSNTKDVVSEFEKHFEGFRHSSFRSSLEHWFETGRASGSFMIAIKEYHKQQFENFEQLTSRISELEAEKDKIEIKLLDAYDRLSKLGDAEQWAKAVEAENKRLREEIEAQQIEIVKKDEQIDNHRWIPVTERSPEDNEFVLCIMNGVVFMGKLHHGWHLLFGNVGLQLWRDRDIEYWQPLPQPPKEQ